MKNTGKNTFETEVIITKSKFQECLNKYLEYRRYSNNAEQTICNVKNYVNSFINFCNQNKIDSISKDNIHDYIISLNNKQNSTIDKYLKNLRLFFRYLYNEKHVLIQVENLIPKTKYQVKSKIPFYWDDENISKLLKTINREKTIGKRDYAIFLILTRLGIRASDVVRLKLDNIDWSNNQIKFIQHKTKEIQRLPLLPDVGNAILDYIINGRNNESNERVLFLTDENKILKPQKLSKLLYKYEKKANIQIDKSFKNGVHSFRNTLARKILVNEFPMDTISQVLGQSNPNTAMIYLKIDVEQLRKCILDWRTI